MANNNKDSALLQLVNDNNNLECLVKALNKKPIETLYLIPYISLHCVEALKVLEKYNIKINSIYNTIYNEKKLRVKLKCFEDSYKKSEKIIINCNHIQDYIFKSKLKLKFLGKMNLYYNIGCYIVDGNIIGNTQYAYYIFQDSKILKKSNLELQNIEYEVIPSELYNYGAHCGYIISAIRELIKKMANQEKRKNIKFKDYKIYYKDFNTNILFKNEKCKYINIFLLHILSNVNFSYYVLQKYENNDNGFWLKTYYITYYYAITKIKKLESYLINNNIKIKKITNIFRIIKDIDKEINSDFRSCMMHFEFEKPSEENSLIKEEYLDYSKKLFGLVESLFNGLSYDKLKEKVLNNLFILSKEIDAYLNISITGCKEL